MSGAAVERFNELDHRWMTQALQLAEKGLYSTKPNPAVGCVVVHGDNLLATGWTAPAGGPHAERVALAAAGERARGATAYVTLEPCRHQGRTGPCTRALIDAGIARVVYAVRDPNPLAGGGGRELEAAGIRVDAGLLEARRDGAEPRFFRAHAPLEALGAQQDRCEHRRSHCSRERREPLDHGNGSTRTMCIAGVRDPERS